MDQVYKKLHIKLQLRVEIDSLIHLTKVKHIATSNISTLALLRASLCRYAVNKCELLFSVSFSEIFYTFIIATSKNGMCRVFFNSNHKNFSLHIGEGSLTITKALVSWLKLSYSNPILTQTKNAFVLFKKPTRNGKVFFFKEHAYVLLFTSNSYLKFINKVDKMCPIANKSLSNNNFYITPPHIHTLNSETDPLKAM